MTRLKTAARETKAETDPEIKVFNLIKEMRERYKQDNVEMMGDVPKDFPEGDISLEAYSTFIEQCENAFKIADYC